MRTIQMILCLFCTLPCFAYQTRSVLPWVTHNDDYASLLTITNLSGGQAAVTLTAVRAGGETHQAEMTLAAGEQVASPAAALFGDLRSGSGFAVSLDSDNDQIMGSVLIGSTNTASGFSPARANALDRSGAGRHLYFGSADLDDSQAQTALVVANPETEPATVTFQVHTAGGDTVSATPIFIPGGGRGAIPTAHLVRDLFPDTAGTVYLTATGDQGLLGCAFTFNALGEPSMAAARAYVPSRGETDTLVGTVYYPWYDLARWDDVLVGPPLIGRYDSREQATIDAQIEQARDHGIDFFLMSWWGPDSWEDITLRDHYTQTESASTLDFAILFEMGILAEPESDAYNINDEATRARFIAHMRYIARTYFDHPAYLRFDGKPVIYFYGLTADDPTHAAGVASLIPLAREALRADGHDVYLLTDGPASMRFTPETEPMWRQFDGYLPYVLLAAHESYASDMNEQYAHWQEAATRLGKDFIPSVIPGFGTPGSEPFLARDPDRFRQICRDALAYLPANGAVVVSTWNEWHENTQVEADAAEGAFYLEIIRDVLAGGRR